MQRIININYRESNTFHDSKTWQDEAMFVPVDPINRVIDPEMYPASFRFMGKPVYLDDEGRLVTKDGELIPNRTLYPTPPDS